MTEEDQLRADIKETQKQTIPCTLCHTETYGRGVFASDEKGMLGAPKDVYRIVIYPICHDCSYKPGYKEEIKRKILSEYN